MRLLIWLRDHIWPGPAPTTHPMDDRLKRSDERTDAQARELERIRDQMRAGFGKER